MAKPAIVHLGTALGMLCLMTALSCSGAMDKQHWVFYEYHGNSTKVCAAYSEKPVGGPGKIFAVSGVLSHLTLGFDAPEGTDRLWVNLLFEASNSNADGIATIVEEAFLKPGEHNEYCETPNNYTAFKDLWVAQITITPHDVAWTPPFAFNYDKYKLTVHYRFYDATGNLLPLEEGELAAGESGNTGEIMLEKFYWGDDFDTNKYRHLKPAEN